MSFVARLKGLLRRDSSAGSASRRQASRNRRLLVESLEARAMFATLVWDGNGGNGKNIVWSAWSNWSPDRTPQSGDALVFTGTRKLSNVNDFSGLSIPQITIQSNGFNLDGNAITLGSGGINLVGGSSSTFGLPMNFPNAATPVLVSDSRTLNLTDVISGPGGIAKSGAGTAILSSSNTFAGDTKISGGSLRLNNTNALQQSTLDYNNYGGSLSFGTLTAASLGGLTGSQDLALTNASSQAVALTVGTSQQNTTYAGVLSGSGRLIKSGNGTFTLTGNNTYTGTTSVNAGTLLLSGTLPNSPVVVNGGVLSGSVSVTSLELQGGALAPGADIGTFTILGDATLAKGTLRLQLNDGVDFDRLIISGGSVVLGSDLDLSVAATFDPAAEQVFPLVNNAGTGTTTGHFAGHSDGQVITLNGELYEVRYDYDYDGDGLLNDVVLFKATSALIAVADEFTIAEDNQLVVDAPGLLANDTLPPTGKVDITIRTYPPHGTVGLTEDGGLIYTPKANYNGADQFVYQITDELGHVAQAAVTIQVTPVNDAPVIGANVFRTTESMKISGRLRASDPDGQSLTYSLVAAPGIGQVNLNPDGTFTYVASSVPRSTVVTFTFAVSDGDSSVSGAATIAVSDWNGRGIRPDVLAWMLEHNPGLSANFLKKELPDKVVLLPNGQSVPIYKLDQFLDVNFRLNFTSRRQEKVNFVESQEAHLRKLLALPEFYYWIKEHTNTYRIAGEGRVSAQEAYDYIRNISRRITVGASERVNAPVGGGNGITAPSWAVWNQMNLFWHEACHVIGIGHNSGGLSGPLAGKLRDWDRLHRWDYNTIDVNQMQVPQ